MRYKVLGRTGVKVSELCLGSMTFGGSGDIWKAIGALDQKQSTEMIARALDAGINFFDTADGYGNGESEIILGKALGARRRDVVIATKVGFPTGSGPNDRGLSRHHIGETVDGQPAAASWISHELARSRVAVRLVALPEGPGSGGMHGPLPSRLPSRLRRFRQDALESIQCGSALRL